MNILDVILIWQASSLVFIAASKCVKLKKCNQLTNFFHLLRFSHSTGFYSRCRWFTVYVTTCSDTRFAVLQDVGIILSGIERNNHIFSGFLSINYPRDKSGEHLHYQWIRVLRPAPISFLIL